METEVWLPIDGYPLYEVSNLGRVRSNNPNGMPTRSPNGVLRQSKHYFGYPMVGLYANGKSKTLTVHGLVCAAFHGPKPTPRHEVAHEDGIPANVSAANLSWKLPAENCADKIRHGTHLNSGQFPRTLTDSAGAAVVVQAQPRRIISLSPGVTESLFAIGAVGGATPVCAA